VDSPRPSPGGPDLLRVPLLGAFLGWRHARTVAQVLFLGLAGVIILDGLFGPQLAPRNLAGVLPWVHWRGFVVLALLVAGNLFCFACPFMLPRRLAKRILPGNRPWPLPFGSKWLAVGVLVVFFWAYEAFSLWSSPWLTAWVAMTYFALAFVVDGFFRGAAFCKHLCPIGQFHFVNSMVSPAEVRVRDPEVCSSCATKDCIRGRYENPSRPEAGWDGSSSPGPAGAAGGTWRGDTAAAPGQALGAIGLLQRGCELGLYQPRKEGNLDCTFCLECVHACPHGNVGIQLRSPLRELALDPVRSGVGRISRRPDLAALAAILVFAAFFNAFGMVTPVYGVQAAVQHLLPGDSRTLTLGAFFLLGLVILPGLLVVGAAALGRALTGGKDSLSERAATYVWALVPLGLGMWTAHYLFHLLIGGLTIVPLVRDYLSDLGILATADLPRGVGTLLPESWILPVELTFLQGGLLLTLVAGLRIGEREEGDRRRAVLAFLPWALLAMAMAAAGVWLLLQPMEMRGTI
jgi:polyferredoxin